MADEFLSQDEVDTLLKGISADAEPQPASKPESAVHAYKLGTRERRIRRRMPTLEAINGRMAQMLKAGMAGLLNKRAQVSAKALRTMPYGQFMRDFAPPTSINIAQMQPLHGSTLFIFEPTLVHAVVDALFGGNGAMHASKAMSEFTKTESRIIQRMLSVVFQEYEKCWLPVYPVKLELVRTETQAQFSIIANPLDVVLVSSFDIKTDSGIGALHVCIPYATVEPIVDALCSEVQGEGIARDRGWVQMMRQQMQQAEVELVASLTEIPVSIRQILTMNSGDIVTVEMPRRIVASIEGVPMFDCHYGTANGKYSLKIDTVLVAAPEDHMQGAHNV